MNIKQECGPKLSSTTRIHLPSDADFGLIGQRWNSSFPIVYCAIVDASCEEDVAATVKYANANNYPFLAFNGTHGGQISMHKFKTGIGITTQAMKSLTINKNDGGKTAWIKGSWLSGHVSNELYNLGKRTMTGSCDSTGFIGPMLGGGHGFLQGRYGLLADQITEMRVVLADGSIATLSENENEDLFWAMRGAGHNFGIVTALRYKIYDIPMDDIWSWSSMVFKGAQLQRLVPVFNKLLREQPMEAAMWFPQMIKIPEYDAVDVRK
jgi:FAD/FMN-containing dehydrogenase